MTAAIACARILGVRESVCFSRGDHDAKRILSYVAAVTSLCTVIALGTNSALGSGGCTAQPNRKIAQGGHWYYRVDRVNYSKCWYLVQPRSKLLQSEARETRPTADVATFSSMSSLFSSLSADLIGANAAEVQHDATSGDPRSLQIHSNVSKNSDPSRGKRSRVAQHFDSNSAPNATLNRKSHAGPRVEGADQPPPVGQDERDHLFQEFLQWNARQP